MPTAIIRFVMLGPKIVVIAIARMIDGNASIKSIALIKIDSIRPPTYPAISPIRVPTLIASPTATKPMRIEMRAPYRMRENMSRPSVSVPSGCAKLGDCALAARFCASGSACASSGAKTAATTITATMMRPTIAPGVRRRRSRR